MASSKARDAFAKAKASGGEPKIFVQGRKVAGVTRENYHDLAKAFMASNPTAGFVIYGRYLLIKGDKHSPTYDEWNAWQAYFWSIAYPTALMDKLGYLGVPCQWPHDFSEDFSLQESSDAIKAGRLNLRDQIAAKHAPVDREVEAVTKALRRRNTSLWSKVRQEIQQSDPAPVFQKPAWTPPTDEQLRASAARIKKLMEPKENQP